MTFIEILYTITNKSIFGKNEVRCRDNDVAETIYENKVGMSSY